MTAMTIILMMKFFEYHESETVLSLGTQVICQTPIGFESDTVRVPRHDTKYPLWRVLNGDFGNWSFSYIHAMTYTTRYQPARFHE